MSVKTPKTWTLTIFAAATLAACGGGFADLESTRNAAQATQATTATESTTATAQHERDRRPLRKLVVFGDSLSDVGSYRTAAIAAVGGGQYTVNGKPHRNWTERLARELDVEQPCTARTGLDASGPLAIFAESVGDHAGCLNYAQGGARVTHPIGPWNSVLLLAFGDPSGYLGQLTNPLMEQITRHLVVTGGRFSPTDLVTVQAGGNDLFMNLATLQATLSGGADPQVAVPQAVGAMGQAGAELAGYVNGLIVAKGARRVLVVNLPDVGVSPSALAESKQTQGLISLMAATFNAQLAKGIAGVQQVLLVDAFGASRDQVANPAKYGLSNVTQPACDLKKTPFPSSLVCVAPSTLVDGDVSRYMFSDTVHPTPYGYRLLTELVTDTMAQAGWTERRSDRACRDSADDCRFGDDDASNAQMAASAPVQ
jgi:phospholipase/lecithinase/hemolysin